MPAYWSTWTLVMISNAPFAAANHANIAPVSWIKRTNGTGIIWSESWQTGKVLIKKARLDNPNNKHFDADLCATALPYCLTTIAAANKLI